MRSFPRGVLVIAALALPLLAVLISFALTDSPRAPQVPAEVSVGSSPSPPVSPPSSTPQRPDDDGRTRNPDLPPPPPAEDDDRDDLDRDDD